MDELEKAIAIQLDPTKVTEADLRAAQAYTAQGAAPHSTTNLYMSQILAPNLHPSFLQSSLRSLTTYAAVVASPEGLRFCCEKLFSSQSPQVKFFCLQVLTDVAKNRYLQAQLLCFMLHLTHLLRC
jgi:hypothetical protein